MNTNIMEYQGQGSSAYQIRISRHALRRAKERIHWDGNATQRMAIRALTCGIAPATSKGGLRFGLRSIATGDGSCCPYLYGEHVYVFSKNATECVVVLLTVYRAGRDLLELIGKRAHRQPSHAGVVHNPEKPSTRTSPQGCKSWGISGASRR
jgi:hypothetical protein